MKNMTRDEVYKDIKENLGIVPSFLKKMPDQTLELEWKLMKKVQMEESVIPGKYKELIGLAVAGATKCHYCSFFHMEMAKLNGATEAEIEDAMHYAKSTSGFSTYINGLQMDMDQFKSEIRQAAEFVKQKMEKMGAAQHATGRVKATT